MSENTFEIEGFRFNVPEYYQRVPSEPEDPAGSIPLVVQTGQAYCVVLAHHIGEDQRMPYDQGTVIDAVHGFLQENQGLVEVEAGMLDGKPYVYTIVKNLLMEGDMCQGALYILSMDIAADDGATHFQGQFEEIGTTGMRDALIGELCRRENLITITDEGIQGWNEDPYDPEWKRGALMNLSEKADYDGMFPEHPLSLARAFAGCVLGKMR